MAEGTVGKIKYDIVVNSRELTAGLAVAESEVKQFSSKVKGSFDGLDKIATPISNAFVTMGKMAVKGGLLAGTAVGALATSATKAYADYQQLSGGVETIFGSSSKTIMKYAQDAYKAAGMSANKYMETATSFSASLLQGLGGDAAKAAEYANKAILDMGDNANKMGTSIESIQYAYQGFAKQNYTMLDNLKLGYGGTASEMARLVNDSGVMGDSFKATAENINSVSFDKIIEAIHVTQERIKYTGTTAQEASGTISGSFSTMASAWDNFQAALASGDDKKIAETADKLVDSASTFAKNAIPVFVTTFKKILEKAPEIIGELATKIKEALPEDVQKIIDTAFESVKNTIEWAKENAEWLTPILVAIGSFVATLTLIQLGLNAVAIATGIWNAVLAVNPIVWIIAIIGALIGVLIYLQVKFNIFGAIFDWITSIWNGLTGFFSGIFNAIGVIVQVVLNLVAGYFKTSWDIMVAIWNVLTGFFGGLWNGVVSIFSGVIGFFAGIFQGAWNVVKGVFAGVGGFFQGVWNTIVGIFGSVGTAVGNAIGGAVKGVVNSILGFAEGTINGFIRAINLAIDMINIIPNVHIDKLGLLHIPRLATGGIVGPQGGGSVIVAGDGGEDEWVVPESKMASLIEQLNSRGQGGGNQKIIINISGTFATSPAERRKVAEQIAQALKFNRMIKLEE